MPLEETSNHPIRFYAGYMRNVKSPVPATTTAAINICCAFTPAAEVGASDPKPLDEAVGVGVTVIPVILVPLVEEV